MDPKWSFWFWGRGRVWSRGRSTRRPNQSEEEGSGGADLGESCGEGVGVIEEREMDDELPEGKIGDAENGASDDQR